MQKHRSSDPKLKRRTDQARQRRGSLFVWLLLLTGLSVLPAMALSQVKVEPRWLLTWLVGVNAVTWRCYWYDKRCAELGRWRVPETTLHLCELLGGWPAAFLAQRIIRHKISKRSYQAVFWIIVLVHQFAALDFLQDWKTIRRLLPVSHRVQSAPGKARAQLRYCMQLPFGKVLIYISGDESNTRGGSRRAGGPETGRTA